VITRIWIIQSKLPFPPMPPPTPHHPHPSPFPPPSSSPPMSSTLPARSEFACFPPYSLSFFSLVSSRFFPFFHPPLTSPHLPLSLYYSSPLTSPRPSSANLYVPTPSPCLSCLSLRLPFFLPHTFTPLSCLAHIFPILSSLFWSPAEQRLAAQIWELVDRVRPVRSRTVDASEGGVSDLFGGIIAGQPGEPGK